MYIAKTITITADVATPIITLLAPSLPTGVTKCRQLSIQYLSGAGLVTVGGVDVSSANRGFEMAASDSKLWSSGHYNKVDMKEKYLLTVGASGGSPIVLNIEADFA